MDLATLVMVTITGFTPGYRWRAVEAFPIKDMATCRAEVGGLIKQTSSPLDRTRSYMFCVAASPRMLADDRFSMQKSIRPWRDIKLWVTRDMLDQCACVPVPGHYATLSMRSEWSISWAATRSLASGDRFLSTRISYSGPFSPRT